MNLTLGEIHLIVLNQSSDSTARQAQRIADDMAFLHQSLGDDVSDELGISISYLVEQFTLLAAAYRAPVKMEKQP
ncbi:hypothetical protein C9E85_03565 [Plesiomonas shigelloides]|uniref:hypothetical protein n=1 Tax=Plesiomonas shigelloides TaxID=703 RepID=UPI000D569495|nr:hypothetical protein [Plesiomonas shigelloides]PVU67093.1 hypothetical protein C9E85_03565 [Plesiomonas shigelloides]